ncbi:MAG TPA: GNAT family N-acetyltransferase [Spirochaetia bacterium]|nr:GNAT family N-acetyltransferase [Spirochaetia bacterium]
MAYHIREADKKDIPVLCGLMRGLTGHEVFPEQMQDRLLFVANSPYDSLYVCEENGRVVGLIGFRIRNNLEEVSKFGEVSTIVVDSTERGKGAGRFMIDYAEKLAADQGCIGTWLVSGFGREEQAHEFYENMGYGVTGYRFVKYASHEK